MLETLRGFDQSLFYIINVDLANPVTDLIMPVVTSDNVLRILYAAAMLILLWKGNARLRWLVGFSAMTVLLTDQLSSNFLKHWIARDRPCHTLTEIHLLVTCGSGFSMPSSHATNMFAQAGLFAIRYPKYRVHLYLAALLVSLSRIFVGVHYPADIIVGGVVGLTVAIAMATTYERVVPHVVRN